MGYILLASHSAFGIPSTSAPVFEATTFAGIFGRRTKTAVVFDGIRLADCGTAVRSKILTALAREHDASLHPDSEFEDDCATHMTAHDWRRDGARVAVKTAQLQWNTAARFWSGDSNSYGARWGLKFRKVLLGTDDAKQPFDELHLAAYTPRGVYLYKHDLTSGVSTSGRATAASGHDIVFAGPRNEASWEAVLDETILPRLDGPDSGCERLGFVRFDDERMSAAYKQHPPTTTEVTYEGVPLSEASSAARGALLTSLAREVDGMLHPDSEVTDPLPGLRVDGRKRGPNQAVYSWRRDGLRIACKGAQLKWDRTNKIWELRFSNIKLGYSGSRPKGGGSTPLAKPREFDELYLALYTPRAVYVYRHDLLLGVTKTGKRTESAGHTIKICGPRGVEDWQSALDIAVLPKLDGSGCELLAVVKW